jgi:pimeloyl-ACP methyl ester carboxylesterase
MNNQNDLPSSADRRGRTYVLIHGAWYGAWCWRDVTPALRAEGHWVHAPTLSGLGATRHLPADQINLETHVKDIVGEIEMEDLKNIHLVGWSYGGMVSTGVLARVRERIKSMIYLDAFVPQNGKALIDYATDLPKDELPVGVPISPIPLEAFGSNDPAIAPFVNARLALMPYNCMMQPVKALAERPLDIPHTYIRCLGFDPSPFDAFYNKFKEDPTWDTYTLKTGHVCMLTHPEETVLALLKAK